MTIGTTWLASAFPDLSNISLIGTGGQKWVFSAAHASDGRVVLKLIQPGQDLERIKRETAALSRLTGERVPRVYEEGTIQTQLGELLWIREQRIVGVTVRDRLRTGPLNKAELLRLAGDVLNTLVAAEAARIVHRDVKPDNIILDEDGAAWLLDFGLSRHLGLESVTATAAYWGVGTPGYAPPEQTKNQKAHIDSRADLFGLGVTLHECAIGVNEFRVAAQDILEVARRVEKTPLSRLTLDWDQSGGFADFVATMVQPLRTLRPNTAIEARDWFGEILARL